MKPKNVVAIVIVAILLLNFIPIQAHARANPKINQASILLTSSMTAYFSCATSGDFDISVSSVTLEVKNNNGTWSFVKNLSAPASASNVSSYNKAVDYSSSCTKGKTYRIKAVFNASGESVNRTSAEKTYN